MDRALIHITHAMTWSIVPDNFGNEFSYVLFHPLLALSLILSQTSITPILFYAIDNRPTLIRSRPSASDSVCPLSDLVSTVSKSKILFVSIGSGLATTLGRSG